MHGPVLASVDPLLSDAVPTAENLGDPCIEFCVSEPLPGECRNRAVPCRIGIIAVFVRDGLRGTNGEAFSIQVQMRHDGEAG